MAKQTNFKKLPRVVTHKRGRTTDFSKFANGKVWLLISGEDFKHRATAIGGGYIYAKEIKKRFSYRQQGDDLLIQFLNLD